MRVRESKRTSVLLLRRHALGLVEDLLGHLDVTPVRIVIAGGDDLRGLADVHPEIGHLLWPLVDQENDDGHLRMIREDGLGDLLEEHGLAGPGWSHDEPALA